MLKQSYTPRSRRERGQALVETALSIIVLLLLLSAIIDFGRAFFTYLALSNAVAEGAYYGSAFPLWVNSSNEPDPNNIVYRTRNEVPSGLQQLITWNQANINVSYSSSASPPPVGSLVTVTAQYPFRMIGPLPGLIGWNGTIWLQVSATQTILTDRVSD